MIPFNKPYITGKESTYITKVITNKELSGNREFTQKCQNYFEEEYEFDKCLLTTSCTDALEMAALLIGIQPGDEVIMPSFTFVSTANAFILRGAKIVFCDSKLEHPGLDEASIEPLITKKTKAIVVVHYAGVACAMDEIMDLAERHNLFVIEDAAQAISSFYINKEGEKRRLGGIGHLSAFSFHETKNIISGEGGLLVVNDKQFAERAEILWEKGTNRSAFFRGEVNKYGWVDLGSSFLPSDMISAFLFAQLEKLDSIQKKRLDVWCLYYENLKSLEEEGFVKLPYLPAYATNNAHMFYLVCASLDERSKLISFLQENGVHAVFHYLSLHSSEFYLEKHDGRTLKMTDRYSNQLVRLPFFAELTFDEVKYISSLIQDFYRKG